MKRSAYGFTLVELMVAVTILGLLLFLGTYVASRERQREQVNAVTVSLAGWLEQVRRASLLGVGCTATIESSVTTGGTIASSQITTGSTTAIDTSGTSTACMRNRPLTMEDIDLIAASSNFSLTSTPRSTISFSPRGTVSGGAGQTFNIVVKLMPDGPSRCIRIQGLLGLLTINQGSECRAQELF